jgi:hypothetical protein
MRNARGPKAANIYQRDVVYRESRERLTNKQGANSENVEDIRLRLVTEKLQQPQEWIPALTLLGKCSSIHCMLHDHITQAGQDIAKA